MPDEPIRTFLAIPADSWRSELCAHLSMSGFAIVGQAGTSLAAWTQIRETYPDVVIVATWLADNDVLTLCRAIRKLHPSVTLILVTAGEDTGQVAALEAGISSCISRDFSLIVWPTLLTLIIQGSAIFPQVTLKQALNGILPANDTSKMVTVDPLTIDLAGQRIMLGERRIRLTRREFGILACLAASSGQVVTFDQLLSNALGCDPEVGTPTQVRLYVSRLRQKLGDDPQTPTYTISRRGVGYRLRSPEQWRADMPPFSVDCFLLRN